MFRTVPLRGNAVLVDELRETMMPGLGMQTGNPIHSGAGSRKFTSSQSAWETHSGLSENLEK